jgi:hypothetical protein
LIAVILSFVVVIHALVLAARGSIGLEGHFSCAVEQVMPLLIELQPDLLVGRDGNVGGTLMLTMAPDNNACTKVTSPVGSTV